MKTRTQLITGILILTALALSACGGGSGGGEDTKAFTATIAEAQGEVEAKQIADNDFSTAKVGLVLEQEGQVKTMADGRAKLDLPNDTIVRVTPSSLFTLESISETNTRFFLDAGTLWIILGGGTLEVDTAAGLAAVTGSYMSVTVDESTGEVYITCLEGVCEVSNDAGSVTLGAGDTAVIKDADTAPEEGVMSHKDVQKWLAENTEAILTMDGLDIPVIGDRVWADSQVNGTQDEQEKGVAGVRVFLFSSENVSLGVTQTNRDGLFVFSHMPPGDYYLKFDPPAGYRFTEMDTGDDDTIDSDAGPLGSTDVFTVGAGAKLDVDAGLLLNEDGPASTPTPTTAGPPPPIVEKSGPKVEDVEVLFGDNEVVKTRWNHACPEKNILVYFPWVAGDLTDWDTYIGPLIPVNFPMSILSVSYPGSEFDPNLWFKALEAVLDSLQEYPCMDENPNVILMGASVGADYALMLCAQFREICRGAVALSPGGYVGQDLIGEAMIMTELRLPVLYMYGADDTEVASQPVWQVIEFDAEASSWIFLAKLESGDHGVMMLNEETIHNVIQFIEFVFLGIT